MPDTRELRSIFEAAEQAAGGGDYASAAQLLREAALLQEANLGPLHPDLANTLNNLGIACEMADKADEAEACYRRASAIATAALQPDHPFVATSRKNLRDFCEARGIPVEPPIAAPASAPEREKQAAPFVHVPQQALPDTDMRVRASRSLVRPIAIGALSACGFLLVVFVVTRVWFGSDEPAGSSPASATRPPPSSPAPTPRPVPAPVPAEPAPAARETATRRARPVASSPPSPQVADARLCSDLSARGAGEWRCDPPSLPLGPGRLFFYTRIRSANDTTIEHRWYHGERLQQAVELRIRASPGSGYRTYSRTTLDTQSAGDWRIELRTEDGILLHEERFVVR